MKNSYSTQIFRVDGKNSFMEVLNTAFAIGKIVMNFCQYNDSKSMTQKLEMYMDIDEALVFSNLLLSGRLEKRISLAKQTGNYEGKAVNDYTSFYTNMGGTSFNDAEKFKKAKAEYPWLTDINSCISKQFKVQESSKYKYMFRAEYALGHKSDTGLIVPDGKAAAYVQIPITESDAIALAMVLQTHIQAYYNYFYIKYGEKLFPGIKCNIFEPETSNNVMQVKKEDVKNPENNTKASEPTKAAEPSKTPAKEEVVTEIKKYQITTASKLATMPKNQEDYAVMAVNNSDNAQYCIVFKKQYQSSCDRWDELKNALTVKEKIKLSITGIMKGDGKVLYFTGLAS